MAYPERQRAPVDRLWTPDKERPYDGESTWIASRDLKLVDQAVLDPGSLTFVTVGLPRKLMRPYITRGSARPVISSRSVIAQLNAEILPGSAGIVAAAAKRNATKCNTPRGPHQPCEFQTDPMRAHAASPTRLKQDSALIIHPLAPLSRLVNVPRIVMFWGPLAA